MEMSQQFHNEITEHLPLPLFISKVPTPSFPSVLEVGVIHLRFARRPRLAFDRVAASALGRVRTPKPTRYRLERLLT